MFSNVRICVNFRPESDSDSAVSGERFMILTLPHGNSKINFKQTLMTQSELIKIFPAENSVDNRVLLLCPEQFPRLAGLSVQECRIFLLVTAGTLTLRVGSGITRIKAGCFIDMLVWEPVEFVDMSNDLQAWCLLPNYIFTNEALNGLKPADSESFKDRHSIPVLALDENETATLAVPLEMMLKVMHTPNHCFRTEMCHTHFRSFMLEAGNIMHHKHRITPEGEGVEDRQDTILRSFLKLVWRYYKSEHNVDFYAGKLCLSSKHLSRVVRDKLGKTPYAVIRDELLQQASLLLKDTKMQVQDISPELHFSEMAAFCKFFKKHTGLSPTAFRANCEKNGGDI